MASPGISATPISAVFGVPDPDLKKRNFHGEVGGTATWRSSAPTNYPNLMVIFDGSNPYNSAQDVEFGGPNGFPAPVVELQLNTAGKFHYAIKQVKADGTHKTTRTYTMCVVPQGAFIHCVGCPPG